MLLVILLALLGLLGTGPVSTGSAEAGDGAIAAGTSASSGPTGVPR